MHWRLLLFFCYSSILHARRHSSQQVCRHRITGQQLSEYPAADTGRTLGCLAAVCLCVLKREEEACLLWLAGEALDVWNLVAVRPNTSSSLKPAAASPLTPSHRPSSLCICMSVFYSMCGLPYVLKCLFGTYAANTSGGRPSLLQPFFAPYPSLLHFVSFRLRPPLLCPHSLWFIFSLLCVIHSQFHLLHFCSLTTRGLIHIPSSISTGLESLVSNHTLLEPAQLCSSTHGNHLKLLACSPPFFLFPLFSYFFLFPYPPFPIFFFFFFLPLRSFWSTLRSLPLLLIFIFFSCFFLVFSVLMYLYCGVEGSMQAFEDSSQNQTCILFPNKIGFVDRGSVM